jgi:hypothetical protein
MATEVPVSKEAQFPSETIHDGPHHDKIAHDGADLEGLAAEEKARDRVRLFC